VYRRVEGIHRCRFLFQKTGPKRRRRIFTNNSELFDCPSPCAQGKQHTEKWESRRVVEFLNFF
jgi:hypothetical protein